MSHTPDERRKRDELVQQRKKLVASIRQRCDFSFPETEDSPKEPGGMKWEGTVHDHRLRGTCRTQSSCQASADWERYIHLGFELTKLDGDEIHDGSQSELPPRK